MMNKIVGIDIGGTKCAVVLGRGTFSPGEEALEVIDRASFPTVQENGPEKVVARICGEIRQLLDRHGEAAAGLSGIGISCGGPLDGDKGLILSPPNLPGWDQIPIVRMVEEALGVKTRLKNDADACALAEWKFGAGRGSSNMIFLTFGTGLGAGFILNGRLYSGASNMAGEVGHIRMEKFGPTGYGKSGSLEGFCSGGGIAQLARSKVLQKLQCGEKVSFCPAIGQLGEITAKSVWEAAEAGDELAKEVYIISGEYLGRGLSLLIDLLNPDRIVIGSIFARCNDLLWPPASKVIQEECLRVSARDCRVVPAGLGEQVGDYAALTVALYE